MSYTADQLSLFESLAFARAHDAAYDALLQLLDSLDQLNRTQVPGDGLFDDELSARINATRFSSALSALLGDPEFDMTEERYHRLVPYKIFVTPMLELSGFETTAFPVSLLSRIPAADSERWQRSQLRKLLLVMGTGDLNGDMGQVIQQVDSDTLLPFVLSLLAGWIVMDEESHHGREALLDFGPVVASGNLRLDHAAVSSFAWMMSSYATRDDKHRIKQHLNPLIARFAGSVPKARPRTRGRRPRVAVIAETFASYHAMYRTYADAVRQLSDDMELLLVSTNLTVDETACSLFDDTLLVDAVGIDTNALAKRILDWQPDLAFYPSLGMACWSLPLANLRLAPIQILGLGHPATSYSPHMDYVLVTEDYARFPQCYSERLLILKAGWVDATPHPDAELRRADIRDCPDPLRVVVASKSSKISWPFLNACRAIEARSERALEWHFFPDEVGLYLAYVYKKVKPLFQQVFVHPRRPYKDYMQRLAMCDLALGTFPFGGTNTNNDLVQLGIPKVFYSGIEAHALSDRDILRQVLPCDDLEATSEAEFIQRATHLIHADGKRVRLARHLQQLNLDETLFHCRDRARRDVVEAFTWVMQHHKEIVAAGVREVRAGKPCLSHGREPAVSLAEP